MVIRRSSAILVLRQGLIRRKASAGTAATLVEARAG
jgi:hypothetical protein